MSRLGTTAAICLTVAAVVSGCGSDDESGSPKPSGPPSIGMKDLRFVPDRAEVKVGEKVTWTNQEAVDHNVTADSGAKFMSKAFGQGQSYSFTPREAGTISYECTLHPGMKGTLVVK
ncbi:MAG TPA: plastocyanin/azurin family copper-binding protein [Thermoleophilaceae bacterium]|nr:plastocyanin/azurin family copper-binding protein [Thermoleophilaceae bacterium]